MMQKHIEKIENLSYCDIDNLSIETLGHFNLFSGKINNGYDSIHTYLKLNYSHNRNIFTYHNYETNHHHSLLKGMLRVTFKSALNDNKQIFATTQRYDTIKAFAEVAQEFNEVEAYYYRLGKSPRNNNNDQSIVTVYDTDRLLELTKQNIEIR